jgi:Electron transfer DM13
VSEYTPPLPAVRRARVVGWLFAALAVAVLLVAGIFVFGRLADDAGVAMVLTAAWFGAVFVGAALVALRRRALLVPMALGYGVVAVLAGIFLALPTLRDKEVNERVVTGAPARPAAAEKPAGNVQVASGTFRSVDHPGSGRAAVVDLAEGGRMLTFTNFETDSGPDLRVYVSTRDPARGGELGDFEDLGGLKGNKGNQQYTLPGKLDLDRYSTVVVWCRAFSVPFTSAPLRGA